MSEVHLRGLKAKVITRHLCPKDTGRTRGADFSPAVKEQVFL